MLHSNFTWPNIRDISCYLINQWHLKAYVDNVVFSIDD